MQDYGLALLLILTGAVLALFAYRNLGAAKARRRSRLAYFDACRPVFHVVRLGRAATGFPRLAGRFHGHEFDLQAVPETLTFRKLPALWVLVSLPAPMPVRANFNLMIRPTGVESFSGFHRLPEQISIPPGFPEDCAIRTDDSAWVPPEHVLRKHLPLFDDPRVKELVISPAGLRITLLAEEADRSRYLFFRDAEMGRSPLPPARITPLLDRLLEMKSDIERHCLNQSGYAA